MTLLGIAARNAILLLSHADHLVEAEGAFWSIETILHWRFPPLPSAQI
ncbi:hypothetical protein [Sphingobium mellinum]